MTAARRSATPAAAIPMGACPSGWAKMQSTARQCSASGHGVRAARAMARSAAGPSGCSLAQLGMGQWPP
eukprot:15431425-Alexandrium_andersonii.AAC.1